MDNSRFLLRDRACRSTLARAPSGQGCGTRQVLTALRDRHRADYGILGHFDCSLFCRFEPAEYRDSFESGEFLLWCASMKDRFDANGYQERPRHSFGHPDAEVRSRTRLELRMAVRSPLGFRDAARETTHV